MLKAPLVERLARLVQVQLGIFASSLGIWIQRNARMIDSSVDPKNTRSAARRWTDGCAEGYLSCWHEAQKQTFGEQRKPNRYFATPMDPGNAGEEALLNRTNRWTQSASSTFGFVLWGLLP